MSRSVLLSSATLVRAGTGPAHGDGIDVRTQADANGGHDGFDFPPTPTGRVQASKGEINEKTF